MQLQEFYEAVLPRSGHYAIFSLNDKKHSWFDSIEQLSRETEIYAQYETQGIYFATASFQEPTKRAQANVLALRALRLDIDAGEKKFEKHPDGAYPTQREALMALMDFIKASDMPPSIIVSSGEGLHVYYVFNEDESPARWLHAARGLTQICKEHGLKVDSTTTEDSARVLRPPGTIHPNGGKVKVLKATGRTYDSAEFIRDEPPVDDYFPAATRAFVDTHVNDDLKVIGPPKSVVKIVANCPAMNHAATLRGDIQEPYWRAMLGIIKFTVEGEEMAHQMSSGYPGYDPEETQRKYDGYKAGPPTCDEFSRHTKLCETCEHRGKIKSPISLGVLNDAQVAALPEDLQPKQIVAAPATGAPWDGCLPPNFYIVGIPGSYKLQTQVKISKEEAGGASSSHAYVDVTTNVFWLSNWAEASDSKDTANVELVLYNNGDLRRYLMDQSTAVGGFELHKWLAGKGIHLCTDKKAGQAMNDYVKLQLQRIKNMAKRPKITGRFGLRIEPNGDLIAAQGPHVIFPDGSVQEAMLADSLIDPAKQYTMPLPFNEEGEWGPDVWSNHVMPRAKKYADFMRTFYGTSGLEQYQLAAMLGLASPFMAFVTGSYTKGLDLPKNGLSVSLYSRSSGLGKTALIQAVMAAYGNPDLLVSDANQAGATDIGRLARLSVSGTFPTSMDEMGNTKETSITSMISAVANGGGKTRGTKDGGFTTAKSWALINLITTNRAQRDMVRVGQEESAAIQYRLLELNVESISFDRDSRAAHRDAWGEIQRECLGALGAVIHYEACKMGQAKLNQLVVACVKKADELLQAEQGARFQFRALGALLFLQIILKQQGLAMFDEKVLVEEFKKAHASGVEYVAENVMPTNGLALTVRFLNDVRSKTIITETETHRGHQPNAPHDVILNKRIPDIVLARHVKESGSTYVSSHALRDWCTEKKISEKDMLHDLKEDGIVLPDKPGSSRFSFTFDLFKGTLEAGAARCSVYKINTTKLGLEIEEEN